MRLKKEILFTLIILLNLQLVSCKYLQSKKEATVFTTYINGMTKKHSIYNDKVISITTDLNKYDKAKYGTIVTYQENDTIKLDSTFFRTKIGQLNDFSFLYPALLRTNLKINNDGYSSLVGINSSNKTIKESGLFLEVIHRVIDNDSNVEKLYIDKIKKHLVSINTNIHFIEELISPNKIEILFKYGTENNRRISKIKVTQKNEDIYSVELSCPEIMYKAYFEYFEKLFLHSGLKEEIEVLNEIT